MLLPSSTHEPSAPHIVLVAENNVNVFSRQPPELDRLPSDASSGAIFLANLLVGQRRAEDLGALDLAHFAQAGKGRPGLLAGTINTDAACILAGKQVEPGQTRRRRAQISHAGKIPRPMRHHAEQ